MHHVTTRKTFLKFEGSSLFKERVNFIETQLQKLPGNTTQLGKYLGYFGVL
jgi:hypothetical protein